MPEFFKLYGDGEWRAKRDTAGDINSYRVFPRELQRITDQALFDFALKREERAGITFLRSPPQQEYCISLVISHPCPKESRVWSLGTGDVSIEETPNLMQFSYYAVGRMKSVEDLGLRHIGFPNRP